MSGDERLNTEGTSQPGSKEAQRLQKEATKSRPGETPGADKEDGQEAGTEDV